MLIYSHYVKDRAASFYSALPNTVDLRLRDNQISGSLIFIVYFLSRFARTIIAEQCAVFIRYPRASQCPTIYTRFARTLFDILTYTTSGNPLVDGLPLRWFYDLKSSMNLFEAE